MGNSYFLPLHQPIKLVMDLACVPLHIDPKEEIEKASSAMAAVRLV